MPTPEHVRRLALALPETTEQPHFEKTSFNVGKKIFATLNAPQQRATLKLSLKDQDLFTLYDTTVIYPVPNKWGNRGWTQIDLTRVPEAMLADALAAAYCEVAPPKLANALRSQRTISSTEEN